MLIKIRILLIFIFICAYNFLFSQNLVHNYSLEDTINCPTGPFQISLASFWFQPNINGSSSEYYNACSDNIVGVPINNFGYQYAHTGNAYAGICLIYPDVTNNYREYIETSFLFSLQENKKYCISFYVSLVNRTYYAVDKIGAYISKDSLLNSSYTVINVQPQIENPVDNIINDTLNWILVSGGYIAEGGEKFITIGNFYDDINTNTEIVGTAPFNWAYYYIDDVSVYLCDDTSSENEIIIFNAFTPNSDGVNDIFKPQGQNIKSISGKIFNRWGMELFEWNDLNDGWDGKYNGTYVSAGAYFYIISVTYEDGTIEEKKGSVQVVK